jgi:VWFA-related protein
MVSLRIALAAILIVSPLSLARQAQAAGTSADPALEHGKKDSGTAPQGLVLQLEVRRVPIDVVVTDKDGNPVRGLRREDFIVKEDKKPQTVLSFDYEDGSVPSYTPAKLPSLPVNTFVNLPTEPERGPLYVLYYDMVNTSQVDQMAARQQILDFIDHAQPGSRFALFVNAADLHLIQGFTSDHALLHAAILAKGPGPHIPDVFIYGSNYGSQDAGASLQCLNFIAEYLSGIPGRKNLLWLSSYFPIPVSATITGHNSDTGVGGGFSSSTLQINDLSLLLSDTIKKTYSAMMRSQVALYPVDLGGISTDSDPGDAITNGGYEDDIASATGGRAFHSNNRVQVLLDKAVKNGESYYTLSYDPTNTKYDGLERKVEVTLANPQKSGYTLSYRKLYYALADHDVQAMDKKDPLQTRFEATKTADTLYANIEHGAPMMHDLVFSTHLAAQGAPRLATAEQMAQLQDSPIYFRTRHKDQPLKPLPPVKLQKYVIDYGVIDPQLKALAAHKGKSATLEFAAAAYDVDGRLLNSLLNEGQVTTGKDAARKAGPVIRAQQELEVPPGASWIRVAVRDTLSNRTGTFEVRLPLKPEMTTAMVDRIN